MRAELSTSWQETLTTRKKSRARNNDYVRTQHGMGLKRQKSRGETDASTAPQMSRSVRHPSTPRGRNRNCGTRARVCCSRLLRFGLNSYSAWPFSLTAYTQVALSWR